MPWWWLVGLLVMVGSILFWVWAFEEYGLWRESLLIGVMCGLLLNAGLVPYCRLLHLLFAGE